MKSSLIALSATALILGGLVTTPARAADASDPFRLSLAIKHAGEPVGHVTFFPRRKSRSFFSNSWEVLGERQIMVWHGRHKAWLVDLRESPACSSLDREIALGVSGGFADLMADGWVGGRNSLCRIDQIRPVDVDAMRADDRAGSTLAQS